MDGGQTSQKCEETTYSSIVQPGDRGHPGPTGDQLSGCLQWGRPQVHRAASRAERSLISCLQHTSRGRHPAHPHRRASRQVSRPLRPPAERPDREARVRNTIHGRGGQRQTCLSWSIFYDISERKPVSILLEQHKVHHSNKGFVGLGRNRSMLLQKVILSHRPVAVEVF